MIQQVLVGVVVAGAVLFLVWKIGDGKSWLKRRKPDVNADALLRKHRGDDARNG